MKKSFSDYDIMEYALSLLHRRAAAEMQDQSQIEEMLMQNPSCGKMAGDMIRFMDEMPGGFLIYRAREGEEILFANQALIRIFQCDDMEDFRELTGNSFRGMVHKEDLQSVEKSIWKQIAESHYDLDYVEYRIIRKDGSLRWVEDYGHFTHSEVMGDIFYVFLTDATEKINRIQFEKEFFYRERNRINQEYLRRLEVIKGLSVNYESILYADLDADEVLPYRMSVRTSQQFRGKYETRGLRWYLSDYIDAWVHPADRELMARVTDPGYIRKKLSEQDTYYVNFRILTHQETTYLQLRIVNIGEEGKISEIVLGYQSIEEEIQREMEQKEIFEQALRDANLAIKAKNTFLSNISHDMRTPLNALFGFASLAKKHMDDKEMVRKNLGRIERASRQLLNLIDKVLEIAWTESNDLQIVETECSLPDIMRDVYRSLLSQASEKNITILLNLDGVEHGEVYGDYDKLKQVMFYLAENAVMYTDNDGHVTISVTEAKQLSDEASEYRFVIKDDGIGMSGEFLAHMFEPFEREKNTTFSGIHGIGLGLTIVKSIVERMGGEISVDSEVGVGSTFVVTLRLRTIHRSFANDFDREEIISAIKQKKILLVEDNEINMEIETELLGEMGFLIDGAENGQIAVDKIKNASYGEYALILMDIQMPVMDGRSAASAIRRLEHPLSGIPIIALSADAFESDKRKSMECGMDDHLAKPLDVPLLLETIVKIMQNRRR